MLDERRSCRCNIELLIYPDNITTTKYLTMTRPNLCLITGSLTGHGQVWKAPSKHAKLRILQVVLTIKRDYPEKYPLIVQHSSIRTFVIGKYWLILANINKVLLGHYICSLGDDLKEVSFHLWLFTMDLVEPMRLPIFSPYRYRVLSCVVGKCTFVI